MNSTTRTSSPYSDYMSGLLPATNNGTRTATTGGGSLAGGYMSTNSIPSINKAKAGTTTDSYAGISDFFTTTQDSLGNDGNGIIDEGGQDNGKQYPQQGVAETNKDVTITAPPPVLNTANELQAAMANFLGGQGASSLAGGNINGLPTNEALFAAFQQQQQQQQLQAQAQNQGENGTSQVVAHNTEVESAAQPSSSALAAPPHDIVASANAFQMWLMHQQAQAQQQEKAQQEAQQQQAQAQALAQAQVQAVNLGSNTAPQVVALNPLQLIQILQVQQQEQQQQQLLQQVASLIQQAAPQAQVPAGSAQGDAPNKRKAADAPNTSSDSGNTTSKRNATTAVSKSLYLLKLFAFAPILCLT